MMSTRVPTSLLGRHQGMVPCTMHQPQPSPRSPRWVGVQMQPSSSTSAGLQNILKQANTLMSSLQRVFRDVLLTQSLPS